MSTVSPSSQLVQVVPDNQNNTGDSSVRTDELQNGSVVDGVIDRKCEVGYLVKKNFDSQMPKEVLYQWATKCHPQEIMGTPPSGMPPASQLRAKKTARVKTIIVDSPKHICQRSGYNFFCPGQYDLKPEHHGKERIITKMIGRTCDNLSESEEQVYQDKGVKDAKRCRTEILE